MFSIYCTDDRLLVFDLEPKGKEPDAGGVGGWRGWAVRGIMQEFVSAFDGTWA